MDGEGLLVVVPDAPGPLIRPDEPGRRRNRDDLDDLIDGLFPDSGDGASWLDGALLAGGAGLLAWALVTGGPAVAVAVAVAMLTLGCILPFRGLLQVAASRRRQSLLGRGVPLRVADPSTTRLVEAYESLLEAAGARDPEDGIGPPSIAAAHAAVMEAASLLRGHPAGSDRERDYVDSRALAIGELAAALRAPRATPELDG